MICRKCGKILSDTANFCSCCGAPVKEPERIEPDQPDPAAPAKPAEPPELRSDSEPCSVSEPHNVSELSVDRPEEPRLDPPEQTDESPSVPPADPVPAQDSAQDGELPPESGATPVPDIVIRKKRISVSDGRLLVDGTYYRKTRRRLKKKKGQISIPLVCVKEAAVRHTPCTGRILAFLLLFLIFAAGAGVSGYFGLHTWDLMHTPYRAEEKEQFQNDLKRLEAGNTQLPILDADLEEAAGQYNALESQLELYRAQRQDEIVRSILADPDFDTHALLSTGYFDDAYRQYLCDLLDAFLKDENIHEWLYPYYSYSLEQGKNRYIADEMPFYAASGGNDIFSEETASPEAFLQDCYNYDLYEHIYYTGRIYITAAEFLNRVLHVPDYAVNGAVFLKAYGGTPDPAALNVPGWRKADYTAFWQDAADYLDAPEPFWMSYDISAGDFDIDWNNLADEQAYYDAYVKFMETIAPDLGVFDMVTYSAGDDSYGGMYYDITGREASLTEIAALYIEGHPEYLEESIPDLAKWPSSLDEQIETGEKELKELEEKVSELTEEREDLAALMDREKTIRADYSRLEEDIQAQKEKLTHNLMIFGGIFLFLLLMALISLIAFIRLLKKPKRLMILTLEDGTEAAFSLRFCSRGKTAALLEILPTQRQDDPHT